MQAQCQNSSTVTVSNITASSPKPIRQPLRRDSHDGGRFSTSPKHRSPRTSPNFLAATHHSPSELQPTAPPYMPGQHIQLSQNAMKMPLLGSPPAHVAGHFAGGQPMVTMPDQQAHLVRMPLQMQPDKPQVMFQQVTPAPGHVIAQPASHVSPVLSHHPIHPAAAQQSQQHVRHATAQVIPVEQAQGQPQPQTQPPHPMQYPPTTSPGVANSARFGQRQASQSSPLMQRQPVQLIPSHSPPPPKTQAVSGPHASNVPAATVAATTVVHAPQPAPPQLVQVPSGVLQSQQQPQQQLSQPQQQPQAVVQAPAPQQLSQPGHIAYQPVPHGAGHPEYFRHQGPGVVVGNPGVQAAVPMQAQAGKPAAVMVPATHPRVTFAQQSPQLHPVYRVAGPAEAQRHATAPTLVRMPQHQLPQQHHTQPVAAANPAFGGHVQAGAFAHSPQPQLRMHRGVVPGQMAGAVASPAGQPLTQVAVVQHAPVNFVPAVGGDQFSAGQQTPHAVAGGPTYNILPSHHGQPAQQVPMQPYPAQVRPAVPGQTVLVTPGYSVVPADHQRHFDPAHHHQQQQARAHVRPQIHPGLQARRDSRHRPSSPRSSTHSSSVPTPPPPANPAASKTPPISDKKADETAPPPKETAAPESSGEA